MRTPTIVHVLQSGSVAAALTFAASTAAADVVAHYDTVMGSFDVLLYDSATPLTVANFLSYVASERYNGTFVHRSIPGFVLQGGGYVFHDGGSPYHIVTDPPIANEGTVGRPNVRGTIAMAQAAPGPDTATSEFFFNLADNPDLDARSFVVFGRVLDQGMDVIDAIAALPTVNAGGPFSDLPVRNYAGGTITEANLIVINSITVVPAPGAGLCAFTALLAGWRRRRATHGTTHRLSTA